VGVIVTKSAAAPWSTPRLPEGLTADQIERAGQVRRQGLADGAGGFFASRVVMPAGLVTDPHHHDHSELIVIVAGSIDFDGGEGPTTLARNDAAVIDAGQTYGFVVGDDGVEFLLIRTALATSRVTPSSRTT
jgi:quercetin dioxygenase-like cupin family protein